MIAVDEGAGHVVPESGLSRIVEDQNEPSCPDGHQFAWELASNRRLGSALAFYVSDAGSLFGDYAGLLATSAATAASNSGRVLLYPACRSCAIFPKPDGKNTVSGARFGTSIAFGFFGAPGDEPTEKMIVGSPFDGDGLWRSSMRTSTDASII